MYCLDSLNIYSHNNTLSKKKQKQSNLVKTLDTVLFIEAADCMPQTSVCFFLTFILKAHSGLCHPNRVCKKQHSYAWINICLLFLRLIWKISLSKKSFFFVLELIYTIFFLLKMVYCLKNFCSKNVVEVYFNV